MKIGIERVCFALAIVNVMTMALILALSIITMITYITTVQDDTKDPGPEMYPVLPTQTAIYTIVGAIVVLDVLISLVAFIFSVVLCNGLHKRRPVQVKAYFVFGVVITLLTTLGTLTILFDGRNWAGGLLWVLWCGSHSLFLILVYKTHKKLSRDALFQNHVRLLEGQS